MRDMELLLKLKMLWLYRGGFRDWYRMYGCRSLGRRCVAMVVSAAAWVPVTPICGSISGRRGKRYDHHQPNERR